MSLYPTKTRKQLLDDIRAGRVYRSAGSGVALVKVPGTGAMNRRVDGQLRELIEAGWVREAGDAWELTDTGTAVLDGAR